MGILLWVIIGLVALFLIIVIYYYNRLHILQNRIQNAYAQIDVQLKKRADLVPNLVNTVKGYATHEKSIFMQIAKLRTEMLNSSGAEKIKKGDQLQKLIKSIFAIAENYPELKASENFKLLQEQLNGIENKIAAARQLYNDSVLEYNNLVTTFPGNFFAKMFGAKENAYFEIPESEKEVPQVRFWATCGTW